MDNPGRYGCPKCGSPKFVTAQDVTEHCSQMVICSYQEQDDDHRPSFEVDDYGDCDSYDSDYGDFNDTRQCSDCKFEYEEPKFYSDRVTVEQVVEASDVSEIVVDRLASVLERVPHAHSVMVYELPHATVVHATPKEVRKSSGGGAIGRCGDRWSLPVCPACGVEAGELCLVTKGVFVDAPGSFSGRRSVFDERGLPVVLRASVCRKCR